MPTIITVKSIITAGRYKDCPVMSDVEYGLTPKGLTIDQILADVHATIAKLAEKPFCLEYPHYRLEWEKITF